MNRISLSQHLTSKSNPLSNDRIGDLVESLLKLADEIKTGEVVIDESKTHAVEIALYEGELKDFVKKPV